MGKTITIKLTGKYPTYEYMQHTLKEALTNDDNNTIIYALRKFLDDYDGELSIKDTSAITSKIRELQRLNRSNTPPPPSQTASRNASRTASRTASRNTSRNTSPAIFQFERGGGNKKIKRKITKKRKLTKRKINKKRKLTKKKKIL
tara:strand:+ start:1174 stop:1611 length:438 start_codon:yes stop_codon:yes gene_type:complete